jgi:hypothetical protein
MSSQTASLLRDLRGYLRTFREYIGARVYAVLSLSLMVAIMEAFGIVMLLPLLDALNAGGKAALAGVLTRLEAILCWFGANSATAGRARRHRSAIRSEGAARIRWPRDQRCDRGATGPRTAGTAVR